MTDNIAPMHYKDLSELDPQEVCQRALCAYDEKQQCYKLNVWGDAYRVYLQENVVRCNSDNNHPVNSYFPIFIVHYLLSI